MVEWIQEIDDSIRWRRKLEFSYQRETSISQQCNLGRYLSATFPGVNVLHFLYRYSCMKQVALNHWYYCLPSACRNRVWHFTRNQSLIAFAEDAEDWRTIHVWRTTISLTRSGGEICILSSNRAWETATHKFIGTNLAYWKYVTLLC